MAKGLPKLTEEADSEETPELPVRSQSLAPVYFLEDVTELPGALENLKLGTGPFAIDAERASGFRYGNRAYLIQVHRRGTDVFLIDPIGLTESSEWQQFAEYCNSLTWILHAATQDLGCLAEIGLKPVALIDTELGSRLLGLPRVSLGAVCEQLLGFSLAKEHSAADWSIRPLPNTWLNYAALDVDVLPAMSEALMTALDQAGKIDWAMQEFESLLRFQPKPQSPDKWRSMTGLHEVKDVQRLAVARELWIARDLLASKLDVAPGRLVPDASLVALVKSKVSSRSELASLSTFYGRASKTYLDTWWDAYNAGVSTLKTPDLRIPNVGIPNHRIWPTRYPEADARLKVMKPVMAALSEEYEVPLENLLQPDILRRIAFEPQDDIAVQMTALGARKWQVELSASKLSEVIPIQKP